MTAKRAWKPLFSVLLALCGCNAEQLRVTTLRLGQSIPELQEGQVIDNLARIAARPASLPYYTVINTGTANIMDTGATGLGALTFQSHVGTLGTLNATASRAITGNWTLNPMSNPDRLRAMRAAYQIALGVNDIDPEDFKLLQGYLEDGHGPGIRTGWLCVGSKSDVPEQASVVSHYGKTYVWVMPQYARTFADFALQMLDIATWSPPSSPSLDLNIKEVPGFRLKPLQPAPGVSSWELDPIPQSKIQKPRKEGEPAPHPIRPRLYEDSQTINRGLFFLPRG